MLQLRHVQRHLILLAWISYVILAKQPKCPEQCHCHLFYHPSDGPCLRVQCSRGGLRALPVYCLEPDIYNLILDPPANDPNYLTIGPVLTQPVTFTNLRVLIILNSNIPSIGVHSFWGLRNLRTLNLTGNNLVSIAMNNFRGLVNLTTLALDYNSIEQMASETFRHLESLQRLSLSHNQIKELVPRLFRMLGKLEWLDLSSNPLHILNPDVFLDTQNLRTLKCRNCSLRRVNVQIYHIMPLIEELDLGDNLFKYLTKDDFSNLKKLKRLRIDRNQVSVVVDNAFVENRELQYLDLSHNRIVLLTSESLNKLTNLINLDVSYNRLDKFVPQAFAPVVKSLQSINLSGNKLPINEISVVLQMIPEIQEVRLENLSLKAIPPNLFMYNNHLTSLDVSSNQMTQFPLQLMLNLRHLQEFDISNNMLNSLKNEHLLRLEGISKINLVSNPWNCNTCSMKPVLTYMYSTVLNESLRVLRCYFPLRLRGMYFSDLNPEMLESCFAQDDVQAGIMVGFLLVLASVTLTAVTALYCTRRRSAQYYTNEEKRRRERDQEVELIWNTNSSNVSTINPPARQLQNSS